MKLSKLFFGEENPSLSRRITLLSILAVTLLSSYGMWTDFIPSATWMQWGFYLSTAGTALITVYLYWGYGTGRMEIPKGISKSKKVLFFLLLPFLMLFILWLALVHGVADAVTLAIGNHYQKSALLLKEHTSSRRSCNYRLTGEALDSAFPNYICISSSAYDALPTYPVSTTLEGKITALGFHVQSIYRNDANPVVHTDSAPAALRR